MKLYYFSGACVLADHIVLERIGAPYETIELDRAALKSPEFLALNPNGVVPVLVDASELECARGGVRAWNRAAFAAPEFVKCRAHAARLAREQQRLANDLRLRLQREVQLQLVVSGAFGESCVNADAVAIAEASWRDSWMTP